jgi:4-amino-4-deoxy-L-arabinose transferase-like glycosyltransferase
MNLAAAALPALRRRNRRAAAAAFVALFAVSQALLWSAWYAWGAKRLIGDENAYHDFALAILAGGAWMPSTIWPPLQPLLLAAVYALAGVHVLAVQLVQTALFVLCGALLRDLWRRLGGSVAAANTAAALFLLNPSTAAYSHWLWPEIPHLTLLLAAFCLLARAASGLRAFAAGACVGLAILAKSLLSAFWPAFLIVFLRRERPWLAWRPAALFVVGLGLVTAPALWHGWREYGRPMIADSSVYNLWVGLTDRWRSDYVLDMGGATLPAFLDSGATPQERNAVYLGKIRALLAERGVAALAADQLGRQYFRLFSAKTPLLSQLPGPACAGHLSVYRTPPWLTRTLALASDAFHALILAAAAFGLAGWRRRPDRLALVAALFVAYQLALFALIHVKARFLLPLLPFLCGFAGSFLAALRARACAQRFEAVALTPPRLVLGAALACLLLFFAFAGPALDRLCAA